MTRLISLLVGLPFLALLVLSALVLSAMEPEPLVAAHIELTHEDMERARRVLSANDPRTLQAGSDALLTLDEPDINLAANYLLGLVYGGATEIDVGPGRVSSRFSLRLPNNPVNPFLNLGLVLEEDSGTLRVTRLSLGEFELPLNLDAAPLGQFVARLFSRQEAPLIHAEVRRVEFQPDRLTLVYRWDPALMERARGLMLGEGEQQDVEAHYRELARVLKGKPGTVAELLAPLFRLARERSRDGDPVAENRAALMALGIYGLGRRAKAILPQAKDLPPLRKPTVTLQGRVDLARHYLVSAALSAAGDTGLADAIGLYKEITDSRGGSGFSFVDLAADRAGTRLGAMAIASEATARRLQARLAGGIADGDLLPPVLDLPEGLSEDDFQTAFGGVGGERYERLRGAIERRLDGLALYRLN